MSASEVATTSLAYLIVDDRDVKKFYVFYSFHVLTHFFYKRFILKKR